MMEEEEEDKTEEVNIECNDLDDAQLRIKTILETTKATRKRISQMNREWKASGDLGQFPQLELIMERVKKDWKPLLYNTRTTAIRQLLLNSKKLLESCSTKLRVVLAKEIAPLLSNKERLITITLPKEVQKSHRRARDLSSQTYYRLQSIATSLDIAAAALTRIISIASKTVNDGSLQYKVTKTIISQLWRKLDSIHEYIAPEKLTWKMFKRANMLRKQRQGTPQRLIRLDSEKKAR